MASKPPSRPPSPAHAQALTVRIPAASRSAQTPSPTNPPTQQSQAPAETATIPERRRRARTSPYPWPWMFVIFALVAFVTLGLYRSVWSTRKAVEAEIKKANATDSVNTIANKPVSSGRRHVIYAVTPAELSVDYEFNIESDGPIRIKAPGVKEVDYIPGKGFTQFPEPRLGPKKFWDPSDPVNGHVAFRIYPVHNGK